MLPSSLFPPKPATEEIARPFEAIDVYMKMFRNFCRGKIRGQTRRINDEHVRSVVEDYTMASSLENYIAQNYSGEKKRKRKEEKVSRENAKKDSVLAVKSHNDEEERASKRIKQTDEPMERAGNWISVETNSEVLLPENGVLKADIDRKEKKKGGIQSQEEIAEEIAEKERKMQKDLQGLKKLGKHIHTTIHRDASGRKLTEAEVKQSREKGSREVNEIERKKRIEQLNKDEAGAAKEKKRQERLEKAKNEGINVYENDLSLIKSQKEMIKAEDPALLFDKGVIGKHEEEMEKEFVSITGRKLYKNVGQYPMNRFNVKPGWRWDGIVRGNGFEKKWHDAQLNKNR